jgi:energy-coupling factor transporter ATP-binding protein EcfA2
MSGAVKQEFFRWIVSLDSEKLTDIDRKLINLLVTHYETLASLSTAGGKRAKALVDLVQKHHAIVSSVLPELKSSQTGNTEKINRITELKIGPFRGFATNESFTFDKKYTFMYGPNGSGKSSFCEGLEYALLGNIDEADAKRIALDRYIRNTVKGISIKPKVIGQNAAGQKVEITKNQALYRFSFVEKNRIDGFARITATTPTAQKDRIATLFGLDAFSEFVDGFTDEFERYISLENVKENAFKTESQKFDADKVRIAQIDADLTGDIEKSAVLIQEVARDDIATLDNLKLFLAGADGVSGIISDLQQKKAEQIPDDLKTDHLDLFPPVLSKIRDVLKEFDSNLEQLRTLSSDVNFMELYTAVTMIGNASGADTSHCPACKTPIEKVTINPFEHANIELEKLKSLANLQKRISDDGNSLAKDVRDAISTIREINKLGVSAGYVDSSVTELTEFAFISAATVSNWRERLIQELSEIEKQTPHLKAILASVAQYNAKLSARRIQKGTIDGELKKFMTLKERHDELIIRKRDLAEEKAKLQKTSEEFLYANTSKLKEIEVEKGKITIYRQFIDSYNILIGNLKSYRNDLPSKLAAGLADRVREFYNTVNAHDPNFERLEFLALPAAPSEKIKIRFQGDSIDHDVLQILSDGHIKVLGLSILLAKAVHQDMGFLIFDDIVNAIDDDHRDGIAELLMNHSDLKNRQHIVTCHGDLFICKLEQKLGSSLAAKEVKHYKFASSENIQISGIQASIGDSKHYLILAEKALKSNAPKDAAARCRQAVESISEQLWTKIGKKLNLNLSVKMRSPSARPDLSSVIDSLIKEVGSISGLQELHVNLKSLKEQYSWNLLNKGTHEQGDQPQFQQKDVADLFSLIQSIEEKVSTLKIEVSSG